jgi:hypothetical protein
MVSVEPGLGIDTAGRLRLFRLNAGRFLLHFDGTFQSNLRAAILCAIKHKKYNEINFEIVSI